MPPGWYLRGGLYGLAIGGFFLDIYLGGALIDAREAKIAAEKRGVLQRAQMQQTGELIRNTLQRLAEKQAAKNKTRVADELAKIQAYGCKYANLIPKNGSGRAGVKRWLLRLKQKFDPDYGWSDYLRRIAKDNGGKDAIGQTGPDPTWKYPGHAHHIVMREGLGEVGQAAVEKSQAILEKYGIDPYGSPENLVWAPNQGHPDAYAEYVLRQLQEADTLAESTGDSRPIVEALQKAGRDYISEEWKRGG